MNDQATDAGQEQTAAPQEEKTLEQLLAEFDSSDQGSEQPVSQPAEAPSNGLEQRVDALTSYVERDMAEKQQQQQRDGISQSVAQMKTLPELEKVPESVVRAHFIATAYDTPGFDKAFEQRGSNPAAYNAILQQAARTLAKDFGPQADPQITADMNAARAAVQGHASATNDETPSGPTQEERNSMSGAEWKRHMQSQIRGG